MKPILELKDLSFEIEERKSENRRREKDMEMFYKAIIHNNEMLYKSLIKVFK